jgi:hypothetical protein
LAISSGWSVTTRHPTDLSNGLLLAPSGANNPIICLVDCTQHPHDPRRIGAEHRGNLQELDVEITPFCFRR